MTTPNKPASRWPFPIADRPQTAAEQQRAMHERRSAAAAVGGRALNEKRKATRWTPTGEGL